MFLQTTFSPVLDGKVISLAILSVALFVTNSVTIYLAKRELEKIRTDADSNTVSLTGICSDVRTILEHIRKIATDSAVSMGYGAENNVHLKRAVEQLDDIKQQASILAASQVKQTENTQRVIEALIDAIGGH